MLNYAILKHPQNWVRVLLMFIVAFMAFDLLSSRFLTTTTEK